MLDRFYDFRVLRYDVPGFEKLSLSQKRFIYYLSQAALWGRDIIYDQSCMINLSLRQVLEDVFVFVPNPQLERYLKYFYANSGIHHKYNETKIVPEFSEEWFRKSALKYSDYFSNATLLLRESIIRALFDPEFFPRRTSHTFGEDKIINSSNNLYSGVTEEEVKNYYKGKEHEALNSRLSKALDGELIEEKYCIGGRYEFYILMIVKYLEQARQFAETEQQAEVVNSLIKFYTTGDIKDFDEYSISWVKDTESIVDFINGFIEVYMDPLGLKGSWESLVHIKDLERTKKTKLLSENAQWFEDNSPISKDFKKTNCTGLSSTSVNVAILGGDLHPLTAIGINLPNASWIREQYGSKSVTLSNIIDAYDQEDLNNDQLLHEFYLPEQIDLIKKYSSYTGSLLVDMHECLGHGSGKLLPGVDKNSLKEYGSVVEEARADLFALYYIADPKLVELGLLPDMEAYKAEYAKFIVNGLYLQLSRLPVDATSIEESHMKDRKLICEQVKYYNEHIQKCLEFINDSGRIFVNITDYEALRKCFGEILRKVQELTSTGDYSGAQFFVEMSTKLNQKELRQIKERYDKLDLPPFKIFVNPEYIEVKDDRGNVIDVKLVQGEDFLKQNLMYSDLYGGVL